MEVSSIDYTVYDCYKNLMPQLHSGSFLLPVPNLWDFHQRHILHFPAYVTFLCDDALIDLGKNLMQYADAENLKQVVELVSSIVNAEILDSPGCQLLLETISKVIAVEALEKGVSCNLLQRMTVERGILPLGLKKLFLNILHELLTSGKSDCNEANYLSVALSTQVKFWNRDRKLSTGSELIQQLSCRLREEEVFNEIWTVVTDSSAAWNSVFQVASVIVNRTSFPVFKKCVERRLVEAIDERNRAHVIVGLALLRGFCSGATEYGAWNAALLTLLPSHTSFVFYIDCLSHIVPIEPTICLKVHINKVPPAPQGAHSALADYLALVRARLSELQETTDWGGLFGGDCADDDGQHDVERVLAHFESSNGQVLAAVMEASVFRKDYYERVFLRRVMEEARREVDGGRSSAGQLLTSLYHSGKCPASIYREWMKSRSGTD